MFIKQTINQIHRCISPIFHSTPHQVILLQHSVAVLVPESWLLPIVVEAKGKCELGW